MTKEIQKYVIIPLRTDELQGNVYRIGSYRFIGELCNFVGLTIGHQRVTEYSYAKHGAEISPRAKEITKEIYDLIGDFLKNIYTTVEGLTNFASEDGASNCYVMRDEKSLYLINGSPDSDWNNFVLVKRDVPNIYEPKEYTVSLAKENLPQKKIAEFLFFEIMDYIQQNLVLLTRLVKSYSE